MTRVLLVHQPADGGVGRHVTDLFAGLTERDWEVVMCGPSLPVGAPAGAPHAPLAMQRAVAPGADSAAVRRFARIVRELRPDVIHAHSSKAGAIARLAKPLNRKIPVLYTPHGYAFAGYFQRELERRAYREAERALVRLTSRVIAVCEAEARLAASVGAAERVRVVHNGISPLREGPTDPRMRELARRGRVICTLTLLRPGKGVETLIDALPEVRERVPDVQLAIVGDGPDQPLLEARARTRGVYDAVHFLGSSPDPIAVLRAADIFTLPSWAEAFPYVILEAMSVGRAIVATDVGGISEAITDGENGLLVPARDPHAIARALAALLEHPSQRSRLGEAARRTVGERFTTGAMVNGVIGVYDEVLR